MNKKMDQKVSTLVHFFVPIFQHVVAKYWAHKKESGFTLNVT